MNHLNIEPKTELVPVDKIAVVNPRVRNQKVFREIVSNIAAIGLKRPITVARRVELCVQFSIFLRREFFAPLLGEGQLAFRNLTIPDVPLARCIDHHGSEGCQLVSYCTGTHSPT
jgi:ParB family transcriptional regulator, chromosome partitioning protein